MIFKIIGGKAVRYDSTGGITKIDDLSVDFSQAESRENISSSDNVRTILGKIMKWFSDLSAGAASSLLGQNLTANKVLVSDENGKVTASAVDASKVPFLSGVTGDVQEQINSLNSTLENISNTDLLYITGYVEKNYSSVTSGKSDTLGGISIKNPGNGFELISYSVTSSWAWAVVNCVKSTDIYYNAYVYFINTYSASINIRATLHTLWKRKFLQSGS